MPRGKQTKGLCSYCQQEVGKGQVAKHLEGCAPRGPEAHLSY